MSSREIPKDVLVEILKRLPVKSILRFKATSKGWCALIKSRDFIKIHLDFTPHRILLEPGNGQYFSFPEFEDDESLAMLPNSNLNTDTIQSLIDLHERPGIASCDGIICFYQNSNGESPPIIQFTLWNPATREVKSLPTSTYGASMPPTGSTWDVGFGYDTKTDDYKVVAIISYWPPDPSIQEQPFIHYAEIYSLKTNSWRLLNLVNIPVFQLSPSYCGTYTHGLFHWSTDVVDLQPDICIVSFDMENEIFKTTPTPLTCQVDHSLVLGTMLNDSVAALYYFGYNTSINVWVMNEMYESSSWSLEYVVEPPHPVYLSPLGLWKNCLVFIQCEDDLDAWTPPEVPSERDLCFYSPDSKQIRQVEVPWRGIFFQCMAYTYKETLVSLACD